MATRSIIRALWGAKKEDLTDDFVDGMKVRFKKSLPLPCYTEGWINGFVSDNLSHFRDKDRLTKIYSNIEMSMRESIKFDFVCYTFGIENHEKLLSMGIKSKLVDEFSNPYFYYRNKLEAISAAMKDYDEILFLDWDTYPTRIIDDRFWRLLGSKEKLQASLGRYSTPRVNHRNGKDNKFAPSGSFIYIRDKNIPSMIIKTQIEEMYECWSEEPAIARTIDNLMGGWDYNKYEREYEPLVYRKDKREVFKKEDNNVYFRNRCHPHRY